jgi:nicotinamidase-related amidase
LHSICSADTNHRTDQARRFESTFDAAMENALGNDPNNLHGQHTPSHELALLLVDVINPLDFPEGDLLLRTALPAARELAALKGRAKALGIPVIYANDNFGQWRSDLTAVVQRCLQPGCKGRPLAKILEPAADDYFVLKPKHSAFFSTVLETLLQHLGTRTIMLGGFATDICVLFTGNDAYMRDYRLVIPRDGCAANEVADHEAAISLMGRILKAETPPARELLVGNPIGYV